MEFKLDEPDRQLLVRALAVQALESPGFAMASRQVAVIFDAGEMFDTFVDVMKDRDIWHAGTDGDETPQV